MTEYIRVLRCDTCKTLEEVPDYEGDPSRDIPMSTVVQRRHTEPDGVKHIGQAMRVEKAHWDSPSTRKAILRQLAVETTGFDPEVYAADAGFRADAMDCWKAHLRVPECSDYKSPPKRLTPATAAERKELGLPKYRSERDVYLCDFCPAKAAAQEAHFTMLGLYN